MSDRLTGDLVFFLSLCFLYSLKFSALNICCFWKFQKLSQQGKKKGRRYTCKNLGGLFSVVFLRDHVSDL